MNQIQRATGDAPSAPPQRQGAMPQQPSTWPVVIGVIGIVFSIFAILGGCISGSSPWLVELVRKLVPNVESAQLAVVDQWLLWIIINGAAWLLSGVLLLYGSIHLMRRHSRSRKVILIWSWLKIMYAIGDALMSYLMTHAAMSNEQGTQAPAAFMGIIGIGGAIADFLFYAALPIFMLIWFLRPTIKREMSAWPR